MKHLQKMIREFLEARGWRDHANPVNYAKSITIEAAELLEIFQWSSPTAAEVVKNPALLQKVKHELADVFIYGLDMADILDLDIEKIIEEKMAYNGQKYPVEKINADPSNYTKIKQQYRTQK